MIPPEYFDGWDNQRIHGLAREGSSVSLDPAVAVAMGGEDDIPVRFLLTSPPGSLQGCGSEEGRGDPVWTTRSAPTPTSPSRPTASVVRLASGSGTALERSGDLGYNLVSNARRESALSRSLVWFYCPSPVENKRGKSRSPRSRPIFRRNQMRRAVLPSAVVDEEQAPLTPLVRAPREGPPLEPGPAASAETGCRGPWHDQRPLRELLGAGPSGGPLYQARLLL